MANLDEFKRYLTSNGLSPTTIKFIMYRVGRIVQYMNDNGLDFKSITEIQIRMMLNYISGTTVKSFSSSKTSASKYVKFLLETNECESWIPTYIDGIKLDDIDIVNKFKFNHIGKISDIQMYVDLACAKQSTCPRNYDTTKAALYLAWYGFTCKDAINLCTSDLNVEMNSILLRRTNAVVTVAPFVMDFLKEYSDSMFFIDSFTGGQYVYGKGEYLLRSKYTPKLSVGSVFAMIQKLQTAIGDPQYKIGYALCMESGVFNRVYGYEVKHGKFPESKKGVHHSPKQLELYYKLFEEGVMTKERLCARLKDYDTYKKAFYDMP